LKQVKYSTVLPLEKDTGRAVKPLSRVSTRRAAGATGRSRPGA
jgi:hypothetical protein